MEPGPYRMGSTQNHMDSWCALGRQLIRGHDSLGAAVLTTQSRQQAFFHPLTDQLLALRPAGPPQASVQLTWRALNSPSRGPTPS
jgi:hypothetical protein